MTTASTSSAPARPVRVCLYPDYEVWREAVTRGGGEVVPLEEADALFFVSEDLSELEPMLLPNVKWVFIGWAGTDFVTSRGLHIGRTWSCARGLYGVPVAEHALGLMLAAAKSIDTAVRARQWVPPGTRTLVSGKRALVVGAGDIGSALITRLDALGVRVTAMVNTPRDVAGAEDVITRAQLRDTLPDVQWVFLALSLSAETRHLIGSEELASISSDAWLINVARGQHVDTDALVEALRTGSIAGAALDVADPEPLPPEHELWSFDNVIVTPHSAVPMSVASELLTGRLEENVRRYMRGEELLGQFASAQ